MDGKPRLFWFLGKPALITPILFLAVFITCFGSSLLFGYSMAILNNLEDKVKCLAFVCENSTISPDKNNDANVIYAGLTATYIVFGTVGSFGSGAVSKFFGSKRSLFLNNIIAIVGGILTVITLASKSIINLFIARAFLGLNAGLTAGIAPMFIAEIAPTELRGALTACHQLSVTIGITVAYLLTLKSFFNRSSIWIYSMGIPLIPAVISMLILPILPESPRHLFINLNDETNAKSAFIKYNEVGNATTQFQEMTDEVEAQKLLPKFRIVDLFMSKTYRLAILISIVLNIMQQFSGINAIIGYSQIMFKDAGIEGSSIEYCVLGIGVLNTLSTIPAVMFMEVGGRRPLLIYPSILTIVSLSGCFLMIGILPKAVPSQLGVFAVLSVVFICLFIVGFAIGMGPIPGIVVAEMFTQAARPSAYSLALGIQWVSAFIILMLYPIINNILPPGFVFLIFIVFVVLCIAFLILFMPETKNRSFTDIAQALSGNKVAADSTA